MRFQFLFTLIFSLLSLVSMSQSTSSPQSSSPVFQDVYFVLVTNRFAETQAFYEKWLGFKPLFSSSWFSYLQSGGAQPFGLAIMDENHPTEPPKLTAFQKGSGGFLTLQVENAEALYKSLKEKGAPIVYHLKSESWGQKRFSLEDPNGLFIDIVEQIQPQEAWWDAYMK